MDYSSSLPMEELNNTIVHLITRKGSNVVKKLYPLILEQGDEENISKNYLENLHKILKAFIGDIKNIYLIETSKFFMEKLLEAFPEQRDLIMDNIEDFIPHLQIGDNIVVVEEFLIEEIMDTCDAFKKEEVGDIFTKPFNKAFNKAISGGSLEDSTLALLLVNISSIMNQVSLLTGFLFGKDLESIAKQLSFGIEKYGLQ